VHQGIQTSKDQVIKAPHYSWPLLQSKKYNNALLKFMYSFKNIYSENINTNSLLIFSGRTQNGKSWMLHRCIQEFMSSENNPHCVKISVQDTLNFDMFLQQFESQLIQMILGMGDTYEEFYDRVVKVLLRLYDDVLLEQQLYTILKNAVDAEQLNNESMFFGGVDVSTKVTEIQNLLHVYENREYRETPLLDAMHEITEILKENYENNKKSVLMDLFYAVTVEKENDKKPNEYYNCSYRDGREVMIFLLDIINDYAGYTHLYYDEMDMGDEEWKEMVKPMRSNQENPYLQNSYPH